MSSEEYDYARGRVTKPDFEESLRREGMKAQPILESTIDYNIKRLEEGLSKYSELVDMLAAKIDRVLKPDFESDQDNMNAIADPGNSGLGSNIGSKAIRVETLNDRLQSLIRRVDL